MVFWTLIREGLAVALHSLKVHRMRTFLAMLGVAIGIFAITLIFTLVNSMTYSITKQLSQLGNRVFFVHQVSWTNEGGGDWQRFMQRPPVSYDDFLKLKSGLRTAEGVCFEADVGRNTIKYKGKAVENVETNGITDEYGAIMDLRYQFGRPMTRQEIEAGRPVAIVGWAVAENLFGDAEYALGKEVRLVGQPVKIVGVLEKMGKDLFGQSKDESMFVPYGFAARHFNIKSRRVNKLIIVRAFDESEVDLVESEVIGLMRASRRLKPSVENNFSINKPEMLMNQVGTISNYLKIGGVIISIFSIIVGGFGIGNIMYTVVKERTFEIGVQKSLGATRSFIVFQFLAEAVLLCIIGGMFGVALQFGAAWAGQLLLDYLEVGFTIVVSMSSVIFGLILSVVIGILSGMLPSIQASRLEPVESMRSR